MDYGAFLAKVITLVVAILVLVSGLIAVSGRSRHASHGHLEITRLNDRFRDMKEVLEHHILDRHVLKARHKAERKAEKAKSKAQAKHAKTGSSPEENEKHVYVIDFEGDMRATAVETMRHAISAALQVVNPARDEIVIRLESGGGLVHSYGLASAQLQRIKDRGVSLTVCVDKVAASGGYMMACVADKILASPFAVVGSIGVVAQIPNVHRLLKKNDIDVEVLTAGEFKRTLTVFGENTEKGRQKFKDDLEDTHVLFKGFVSEHRPVVDIDKVATGDVWFGKRALEVRLVDELMTSDEYLLTACNDAKVYQVKYTEKKSLPEKLGLAASEGAFNGLQKLWGALSSRFPV